MTTFGLIVGAVVVAATLVLGFGKGKVRVVESEFELRFQPVEGVEQSMFAGKVGAPSPFGKAERTAFRGGDEELKLWIRGLNLPPGTVLILELNGQRLANVTLGADGMGRLELLKSANQAVPRVKSGDALVVKHGERRLLKGTFVPD